MSHFFRKTLKIALWLIIAAVIGIIFMVSWRIYLNDFYSAKIYSDASEIPSARVAIVPGADASNFRPSDVLVERLSAAIRLYKEGKVEKLLFSGDNRFVNYNEPEVMKDYALSHGVPESAIVLDYAGRRTYDTCYRAKHIFGLDKAIIVTNGFHLPRGLYICEGVGIDVSGFDADRFEYSAKTTTWWNIRETLAVSFAAWDLLLGQPAPVMGEQIPI